MKPLRGKIAVVAGATRGAGRGIACMLGEAGTTVYCTGRTSRTGRPSADVGADSVYSTIGRPETIEETAEMVTEFGGEGIAVRVDHSQPAEVSALFDRVRADHGKLDILVNDIWGGDALTEWGTPFWESSLEKSLLMLRQAVDTHIITSRYGVPLIVEQGNGLVVEITDGDSDRYRGNVYYDLVKMTVIRLAHNMAQDLKPRGVTAVAVTPGFLRSEAMLDGFGVTEANWRDAVKQEPHFIASETPYFVGRAIASLAADPNKLDKSGGVYSSWGLSDEYGFEDMDGNRPHWGRYFAEHVVEPPSQ